MNRKEIVKLIESVLERTETRMNAEIPHTGARVVYVAMPGKGRTRKAISDRARQVFAFLQQQRQASAQALQKALNVNRNVIAGAVYELRSVGLVKSQRIAGPAGMLSAAGKGRKR